LRLSEEPLSVYFTHMENHVDCYRIGGHEAGSALERLRER